MPEGEDPAEMMQAEGGSERLARGARRRGRPGRLPRPGDPRRRRPSTPTGRDKALDEVVPVLVGMGETITRQEMVREVADRLDAPPEMIVGRMRSGGRAPRPTPRPSRRGRGLAGLAGAAGRAATATRRRRRGSGARRRCWPSASPPSPSSASRTSPGSRPSTSPRRSSPRSASGCGITSPTRSRASGSRTRP